MSQKTRPKSSWELQCNQLEAQLAALTAAQERLSAKVQARTLRRCAEEIENSMRNPVVSDRELLLNGIAWYRAQADNLDPHAPHAASSPTTTEEKRTTI